MLDEVARRQKSRPFNFSAPLRLAMILGEHMMTSCNGRFYAKAQNLVRLLTAEYNKVLESYDVMIMPTTLKTAPNVLLQNSSVAGESEVLIQNKVHLHTSISIHYTAFIIIHV